MQNKIILIVLALFTFIICMIACSEESQNEKISSKDPINNKHSIHSIQKDDVILILLTVNGGNHFYALILGSDTNKVMYRYYLIGDNSYNGGPPDKVWKNHIHILSQNAIDHIWKYIQDNCIPSEGKMPFSGDYYNITKDTDTPFYKTGCVVESKENGIKYFSGLIAWIDSSSYSYECRYLIGDIKGKFVDGKSFPLPPYYQSILDGTYQGIKDSDGSYFPLPPYQQKILDSLDELGLK